MPESEASPPYLAANLNGPLDAYPFEFYSPHDSYDSSQLSDNNAVGDNTLDNNTVPHSQTNGVAPARSSSFARSISSSPAPRPPTSIPGPVDISPSLLNSAKSNPDLASRLPGTVKDIANRFNRGATIEDGSASFADATHHERYRPSKSSRPRSPNKSEYGAGRVQKKRSGRSRSPKKQSSTASLDSNTTVTSIHSRPRASGSPQNQRARTNTAGFMVAKPLFGEITADGAFHGNFQIPGYGTPASEESHAPSPKYSFATRRQSDGGAALGHGRTQSHQELSRARQTLAHKRSRTQIDAPQSLPAPSLPHIGSEKPSLYVTPPNSVRRPQLSRIPISTRHHTNHSAPASPIDQHIRPDSAMSNPSGRGRISRPSTPKSQTAGRENTTPTGYPRSRYQPSDMTTPQSTQTLSAKIVAMPATSPPLRSSRPRQPVNSATTSASRARAAERFQGPNTRDGRRPSEQWMGKPYDAQKERSKRDIPELRKVDFAERRAKIQEAISRNLDESRSSESLRSQSRQTSREHSAQATPGASGDARNTVDQHQADEMNRETDAMETAPPALGRGRTRGLSLHTTGIPELITPAPEPLTAATLFEDESPILGKTAAPTAPAGPVAAAPPPKSLTLLTSATYRPPTAPLRTDALHEAPPETVQSPSVLDNVMQMRQHSPSSGSAHGTDFAEDSSVANADSSPSDIDDRWILGSHGLGGDQGSIRIMLDEDADVADPANTWSESPAHDSEHVPDDEAHNAAYHQERKDHDFTPNGYTESPVDEQNLHDTPRKHQSRDDVLKPDVFQPTVGFAATSQSLAEDAEITRMLNQYHRTGTISAEMFQHIQQHTVDLDRMSANGGSDAFMVQNLLDSILNNKFTGEQTPNELPPPVQYDIPALTPDTPPDAATATGTAVVFGNNSSFLDTRDVDADDDDFQTKIRKADAEWERHQRGEDTVPGADTEPRPTPPPKDQGYTPRSSTGPGSAAIPSHQFAGLRTSTGGETSLPEIRATGIDGVGAAPVDKQLANASSPPPLPHHAPPAPPLFESSTARLLNGVSEASQIPASYSDRGSGELSPRLLRNTWGLNGSARPSIDSQQAAGLPYPSSVSFSSVADSATRQSSVDADADGYPTLPKTQSPSPEQKRLQKRRHIIKELLDTENTYHQDLKIIEDIYKATVADLVSAEDKKTLFGNCDEIERFSLHFYDDLRKAVATVYVPPKQIRWANKRGSQSTTHSDQTGQTSTAAASTMSTDNVDEERDRFTIVGETFLRNLQQMDHVYGTYLKNHDAANQRLSALKDTPSVKCWLEECHNNASDITSAWDLDSLLVKPTQRVSKYPMLLQQLLETTPATHPDHDALKSAVKDSITLLTRINEAKKRADIVDQIINRKGKDSDVRSGIAKAFGRRTEKLKERVGIAEAFQDQEFDELAHKFGGHYIRLQICMRDVQDYLTRIDRSMEQIGKCAAALELYTDVSPSSLPEIESKWRRYGQAIREISTYAFPDHKAAVQKRVIDPMVTCIKLHEGPQSAIHQRKRRIVDYAKCKSIEKRGEKPDKKTLEASEMYVALNDHLKVELPKLYALTASLVQGCLTCFLDVQLSWYNVWERKLRPTIDAIDIPASIAHIEPAFRSDFEHVKNQLSVLGICNGAILADSANYLSPTATPLGDSEQSAGKSPRTLSVGSENSSKLPSLDKRHSSGHAAPGHEMHTSPYDGRIRSNSSYSTRATQSQTSVSALSANQPWASDAGTPASSFSQSRPTTANISSGQYSSYPLPRASSDYVKPSRPSSSNTYVTARAEPTERFSGIFSSAMPPDALPHPPQPPSPRATGDNLPVMFVCASLFEFSIDKTRKEAGYPYLTYAAGEVFDVIAQKGELWLAKNQDDAANHLGWIWEQHFIILSGE